jgi:hypothetical protein
VVLRFSLRFTSAFVRHRRDKAAFASVSAAPPPAATKIPPFPSKPGIGAGF